MPRLTPHAICAWTLIALSTLTVSGCGSGGSDTGVQPPAPSPTPSPTPPPTSTSAQAAEATAQTHTSCTDIAPFYWEIGDVAGVLASGQVGSGVTAQTPLNIASASKWPFAAYVVQKYGVRDQDIPFLRFTSGYSNFDNAECRSNSTVAECMNGGVNADEAGAGTFHYQGGHMQQLAVNLGLGSMRNDGLGAEVVGVLAAAAEYWSPQPPGGMRMTPASYAQFLREMLDSRLSLGTQLGTHAVCTQRGPTCTNVSDNVYMPEPFFYSLGHWVETNPNAVGGSANYAYSSAGAFGFYPWIDAERKLYGMVAREEFLSASTRQGYASLICGRLIRWAWKTGVQQ